MNYIESRKRQTAITTICYICGFDNEDLLHIDPDNECFCCDVMYFEWVGNPHPNTIYFLRKNWIKERNGEFPKKSSFDIDTWNIDIAWKQITENVPKELWENDPLYLEYIASK